MLWGSTPQDCEAICREEGWGEEGASCVQEQGCEAASECLPFEGCREYCALVQGSCEGEWEQFTSFESCLSSCIGFAPIPDEELIRDSLACRLSHARQSPQDPTACLRAGPNSFVCTDSACRDYCPQMLESCPEVFESEEHCLATCQELRQGGEEGTDEGDSLQCRLTWVRRVETSNDPVSACRNASPTLSRRCNPCAAPDRCPANQVCEEGIGTCSDFVCEPDRFEPNEGRATAIVLEPIDQVLNELTICGSDGDSFLITLPPNNEARITLYFRHYMNDLHLGILEYDFTDVYTVRNEHDDELFVIEARNVETTYLIVIASVNQLGSPYELEIDIAPD